MKHIFPVDFQIAWFVIYLAVFAFAPIRITTGIQRSHSLMEQHVIRLIRANNQIAWIIVSAIVIVVMHHCRIWEGMAQSFLRNKNMNKLKNTIQANGVITARVNAAWTFGFHIDTPHSIRMLSVIR